MSIINETIYGLKGVATFRSETNAAGWVTSPKPLSLEPTGRAWQHNSLFMPHKLGDKFLNHKGIIEFELSFFEKNDNMPVVDKITFLQGVLNFRIERTEKRLFNFYSPESMIQPGDNVERNPDTGYYLKTYGIRLVGSLNIGSSWIRTDIIIPERYVLSEQGRLLASTETEGLLEINRTSSVVVEPADMKVAERPVSTQTHRGGMIMAPNSALKLSINGVIIDTQNFNRKEAILKP